MKIIITEKRTSTVQGEKYFSQGFWDRGKMTKENFLALKHSLKALLKNTIPFII